MVIAMKIAMSGGRPTGYLHLGHYLGAFSPLVETQYCHENYLLISDMHMLMTRMALTDIESLPTYVFDMIVDCIGMGMDPDHTHFYLQSAIPEIPYLYILLQNLTTLSRVRSVHYELNQQPQSLWDSVTLGLYSSPVVQAADIFALQADIVTVGLDNIDFIHITREIIQRFNKIYNGDFVLPDCVTGRHNNILGLDGQEKMSKSLHNSIQIRDSTETIAQKIDSIPWQKPNSGHTNIILEYLKVFSEKEIYTYYHTNFINGFPIEKSAREQLKQTLEDLLNPMRERISEYLPHTQEIRQILIRGTRQARARIHGTYEKVLSFTGMHNAYEILGLANNISLP